MSDIPDRSSSDPATALRILRRNYIAFTVDGGFYMGGLAFINVQTILPRMVETLGGPRWLIGFLPLLVSLGSLGPALFITHRFQRMERMHGYLVMTGGPQRLPYLLSGLALIFFGHIAPWASLALVLATPLIAGLFTGFSLTPFQELVARTIPEKRRSSLWALRWMVAAGIGVCAGKIVNAVLASSPGPVGYGILYLLTFGCIMVSYCGFMAVREIVAPANSTDHSTTWLDFARSIPGFIRQDRQLRRYLSSRVLCSGMMIMLPFLSLHMLKTLEKPDSYLGYVLMAQMAGNMCGTILAGVLGDRSGSRLLLLLSNSGYLLLTVWACLAHSSFEFTAVYFLLGAAMGFDNVGVPALGLAICPQHRRVGYLSTMGVVTLAGLMIFTLLNTVLQNLTTRFIWVAVPSLALIAGSLASLGGIVEPRRIDQDPSDSTGSS